MKLQDKVFVYGSNNGVEALAALETVLEAERDVRIRVHITDRLDYARFARLDLARTELSDRLRHTGPTFTFCSAERFRESPWMTGTEGFLKKLIAYIHAEGGTINHRGLFVPFSNGSEIGLHGPEAMAAELRYVATYRDFADTFGISIMELSTR